MDLVVNFSMFWKNVTQLNAFQKCKIVWKHVLKKVPQAHIYNIVAKTYAH